MVTRNLNRIIDINFYPVETARRSNLRHRPIGIGVQVLCPFPPLRPPERARERSCILGSRMSTLPLVRKVVCTGATERVQEEQWKLGKLKVDLRGNCRD